MNFLSSIWAKIVAVTTAVLAVLFVVWRIFAKGESVGEARQERKQQKKADEAKAKMDQAKEVKGEKDTLSDLDSNRF